MSEKNGEMAKDDPCLARDKAVATYAVMEKLNREEKLAMLAKIFLSQGEALDQKDRDHEALIGVLVGALENLIKAQDERLQLKYSATGRPEIGSWLWDEARTALSLSESRGVKKGMMRATDRDMAFINHIQDHLKQGQEVICKVCGKTAKKIIEEAEALSTQAESEEGSK